ncbi:MAG: gamma-glutamylcyclotransferase [Clostridiales bacterium]|jgi:gamma-glutamylcyclotransferase (GGCT)/AIG2-like uncharacterized protein YtfP|nr:gamma-glutamylcyclotransferase [Clostridiales bacterium]
MAIYKNDLTNSEPYVNRVFVYGSLMKGFWNYKWYLEGRTSRIIPGKTYGLLYHLPEGYPALLPGNEIIHGEVMELVDKSLLNSLDMLEGYDKWSDDNLYVRETRCVWTEDGEEMLCWIYIYADESYAKENGILVPSGNWRKFMERRGD